MSAVRRLKRGLKQIINAIHKLKDKSIRIYRKNKLLGLILLVVWLLAAVILIPILYFIGGVPLVIAYITCKLTGVCPL